MPSSGKEEKLQTGHSDTTQIASDFAYADARDGRMRRGRLECPGDVRVPRWAGRDEEVGRIAIKKTSAYREKHDASIPTDRSSIYTRVDACKSVVACRGNGHVSSPLRFAPANQSAAWHIASPYIHPRLGDFVSTPVSSGLTNNIRPSQSTVILAATSSHPASAMQK